MDHLRQIIHPGLRGALFYALYWGAMGLVEPFLTVFYLRSGLDAAQIGWVVALLPLCTLVITPLVTRLADRTHKRTLALAISCLGFAAAATIPAWPGFQPGFGSVLVFVALYAAFRSPIVSLADSLITSMANRRALDFGAMRLWGSIVFTITSIATGAIWERTGFRIMFISGMLCLLPVVLSALLLDDPTRPREDAALQQGQPPTRHTERFSIEPSILFLLAATFMALAGLFMAMNFTPVYLTALNGSQAMVGAMVGASAAAEVPGMLFGGRIARRLGPNTMLILSYLIIAIGIAGVGLVASPGVLVAWAVVRGLGFGLMLVGTVTTINTRAPSQFTSTYQGILNAACWGLAPLLGGPFSGWVYQNYGPRPLFLLAGGMTLAAVFFILPTYKLWRKQGISKQKLEIGD